MKIIPYLVDWTETEQNLVAVSPRSALAKSVTTLGAGAYPIDFPESYSLYMTVAEAYEQMRHIIPDSLRTRVDQFMSCLITFDGHCQDIREDFVSNCALSISPESALKLAYIGNQINWEGFQPLYYNACENYIQESLARFKRGVNPAKSFEEVFAPYLKLWLKMLNTAVIEERGIVVLWG